MEEQTTTKWRPSLAELIAPMSRPRKWSISLEPYRRGIDNAHVDCVIDPRFEVQTSDTIRKLIREDVASQIRRTKRQLVGADELSGFRDAYQGLFDSALEQNQGAEAREPLILLQLALLKLLLRTVETRGHELQKDLYSRTDAQERLALITGLVQRAQHRVMKLLFRQIRTVEDGHLRDLRYAAVGKHWPISNTVLFNPVLLLPDPGAENALTSDYPIAWLGDAGIGNWMASIESTLSQTFEDYLPEHPPSVDYSTQWLGSVSELDARRDQGDLPAFLATEILLKRFIPRQELRRNIVTWMDEPGNLMLFLEDALDTERRPKARAQRVAAYWHRPGWSEFCEETLDKLNRGLESAGISRTLGMLYALPTLRSQLGATPPLSLVLDYADGRLSRRRLDQRLATLRSGLDAPSVQRSLDRILGSIKQHDRTQKDRLHARALIDFLALRRDLKLAFRTYEVLDGIRLLADEDETRLSRANRSLYSFQWREEQSPRSRRIRSHAVVKADLRGSTLITEELRARGLNPASHFSINFFDPVNALLGDYEAEKLFVEGDAVILALYEYEQQGPGFAVSRACRLARKIIQVVMQQNVVNRRNDLPELELGIGISYSDREPNFLYDEGHRIMISSAINQADRLSSSSGLLRRAGYQPHDQAFRVSVVHDAIGGEREAPGRDLLAFNVNGVRLDEVAFLKLQAELPFNEYKRTEQMPRDGQLLLGSRRSDDGRTHWLLVRRAPILDWDGYAAGPPEPDGRHFYELILDDELIGETRANRE